ncbi:hypothetical protein CRG98_035487 [Punica granatum]|uniref:Retrotransposon gag domain-containing protein n=1 Tax=Punica granatum TaxID=22663 RepID=A0A2I0IK78_PUNGR|nr:hypothetical protein CRG98_035487 [Punica granatum]
MADEAGRNLVNTDEREAADVAALGKQVGQVEQTLHEILNRLNALGLRDRGNANYGRAERVAPRAPQHLPRRMQVIDDSEDDEELLFERAPRNRHHRDFREADDFKLKVDILVERFFEFTEVPEEKRVKLVAYRLKGGASTWWDRIKTLVVVEAEDDVEDVLCDPDDEQDVGVYDDDDYSQALVIRKLMLASKQEDESQRNKLFRTFCLIKSRPFIVIIDSGSQENIIGKTVVEKLKLPVEKHPNPYSIGWIKAYDNDAKHLGRDNTYQLVKEGVRYTLLPMSKKSSPKANVKGDSTAFLIESHSEREMDAEFKELGEMHILIVKELPTTQQEEKIPEEV